MRRPALLTLTLTSLLFGACGDKEPSDDSNPADSELQGPEDADQDGYDAESDCDDADPAVFPGAPERCNQADDDCDGSLDEDPSEAPLWYSDLDGDGYGDPEHGTVSCGQPEANVADGSDCDDSDPAVNPAATELCDSLDNDCDGDTDEADAEDALTWYNDADSDGYGDPSSFTTACEQPEGALSDASDCDDSDAAVSPEGAELCNSLDDNCDGSIDEDSAADASTWYLDEDGDGFGLEGTDTLSCQAPDSHVAQAGDCDDGDAAVSPDGTELCNDLDDNCDGSIDEDSAADASTWYADSDNDGFGDPSSSAAACEVPSGYLADSSDCDDSREAVNPDATELCNKRDDNCDGDTDEDSAADAVTWFADSDGDGYGDSTISTVACWQPGGYSLDDTDCDDTDGENSPGFDETCDGKDNDCDGDIDWSMNVPLDYSSITSALSAASAGDTICVGPGTYVENLTLDKSVSVVGYEGSALTILDGNKAGRTVKISAEDVELRGFTIQNGIHSFGHGVAVSFGSALLDDLVLTGNYCSSTGICFGVLDLESGSATLSNSTIQNHSSSSMSAMGAVISVFWDADLALENVKIVDNTVKASSTASLIYNGYDCTFSAENLIIAGNTLSESDGSATIAGLLYSTSSSGMTLQNSTIVGNTLSAGTGTNYGIIRMDTASDSLTLLNTSISDNTLSGSGTLYGVVSASNSPSFTASYNNFYDNGSGTAFSGVSSPLGSSGNIEVDPLYVDSSATLAVDWDLSLGTGSPLIDVGDPSVLDADGSVSDIGAYGGPGGASW